jgi:hypothetical protein
VNALALIGLGLVVLVVGMLGVRRVGLAGAWAQLHVQLAGVVTALLVVRSMLNGTAADAHRTRRTPRSRRVTDPLRDETPPAAG